MAPLDRLFYKFLRINAFVPKQVRKPSFYPRTIRFVPGSPYKNMPLRVNVYGKLLTLLGLKFG
jgi:hypothetical protein